MGLVKFSHLSTSLPPDAFLNADLLQAVDN
jgi:hypothetical protein